jgi:predicted cation transporter
VSFLRPPKTISITTADAERQEINQREVRYILTMALRVVLFIAAVVLFHGIVRWIAVVASLILPWIAVMFANQPKGVPKAVPVPPMATRPTGVLPSPRERVVEGEWRTSGPDSGQK